MIGEETRVRTSRRGLRRHILIAGSQAMMRLDHTRCRSPSKLSNLDTVRQVSRQAMGEGEGRDGCKTMQMGLKSFGWSICIFHF